MYKIQNNIQTGLGTASLTCHREASFQRKLKVEAVNGPQEPTHHQVNKRCDELPKVPC